MLREDLTTLSNYLPGGFSEVAGGLFCQARSDGTEGNSLKSCQGRLRLAVRKHFFTEMVAKCWNRLPGEVVESPSLEIFNRCVDMALRDMI